MSYRKFLLNLTDENRVAGRLENGVPVRGNPLSLRQQEYESITYGFQAHVRAFRLWNDEERLEFEKVRDKVANQACLWLTKPVEEFVPEERNWVVLAQWADIFGEPPPSRGLGTLPNW